MKVYGDIKRRFVTMAVAIVTISVLCMSSVARFHHHDCHGVVHYGLVCNHNCGHEAVGNELTCCDRDTDPPGTDEDSGCGLHIDILFFEKNHIHSCQCAYCHSTVSAFYNIHFVEFLVLNHIDNWYTTLSDYYRPIFADGHLAVDGLRGPPVHNFF